MLLILNIKEIYKNFLFSFFFYFINRKYTWKITNTFGFNINQKVNFFI